MTAQPEIRVRIGTLTVSAGSAAEARRIADGLPAALERALRTPAGTAAASRDRVDVVARTVADAVLARIAGERR